LPSGEAFTRVALDPAQRAGVLTQGAILATHASAKETSPVSRGVFVRERLLCSPPPPPPANVETVLPEPDGKASVRERLAKHRSDPACAGCHKLIDPIGFGFEAYDAVGLWRGKAGAPAIDVSGEVFGTNDADGVFEGVPALAMRLGASGQVSSCVVETFARYAYGRSLTDDDCSLATVRARLGAARGRLSELLVALTQTDAFLARTNEGGIRP
jgi:hypothetical protein